MNPQARQRAKVRRQTIPAGKVFPGQDQIYKKTNIGLDAPDTLVKKPTPLKNGTPANAGSRRKKHVMKCLGIEAEIFNPLLAKNKKLTIFCKQAKKNLPYHRLIIFFTKKRYRHGRNHHTGKARSSGNQQTGI
jgi:hypothetical protein